MAEKINIKNIMYQEFERLRVDMIAAMVQNRTPNGRQTASGQTAASLEIRGVSDYGGALYANSYFSTLITGRRPGKVPFNFEEILMQWASYKGISFSSQSEVNSFIFLTLQKIRQRGSYLFRIGGGNDFTVRPVATFADRLAVAVGNEGQAEVSRTIDKYIKNRKL